MRLAVLIIGLVLTLVVGVQSCAVAVGGEVVTGLSQTQEQKREGEEITGSGGVGLVVAFLYLLGAAFVMARPKVSMILFFAAGVLALLGGVAGFTDLYIWGSLAFVLGGMSYFGFKEKRRKERVEPA